MAEVKWAGSIFYTFILLIVLDLLKCKLAVELLIFYSRVSKVSLKS